MARPLSARLFDARVALVAQIDATAGDAAGNGELRQATAAGLAGYVAAMNTTNVVVRPKRRLVEHYSTPQAWGTITAQSQAEVSQELATLPAEVDAEPEESKRFDLLMLNLQLAYLRADPSFARLRARCRRSRHYWKVKGRSRWCGRSCRSSRNCRPTNGGKTSPCQCWKPQGCGCVIWCGSLTPNRSVTCFTPTSKTNSPRR